jgi:hypothetical protein
MSMVLISSEDPDEIEDIKHEHKTEHSLASRFMTAMFPPFPLICIIIGAPEKFTTAMGMEFEV